MASFPRGWRTANTSHRRLPYAQPCPRPGRSTADARPRVLPQVSRGPRHHRPVKSLDRGREALGSEVFVERERRLDAVSAQQQHGDGVRHREAPAGPGSQEREACLKPVRAGCLDLHPWRLEQGPRGAEAARGADPAERQTVDLGHDQIRCHGASSNAGWYSRTPSRSEKGSSIKGEVAPISKSMTMWPAALAAVS